MIPGSIKQIFPKVLDRIGVNQKNFATLSLIEKELAAFNGRAQIVGFKNGKVFIEVDSSAHYYELLFKKKEILKYLQNESALDCASSLPELKIYLKGTAQSKFKRAFPASK